MGDQAKATASTDFRRPIPSPSNESRSFNGRVTQSRSTSSRHYAIVEPHSAQNRDFATLNTPLVINESAARALGFASPEAAVGKSTSYRHSGLPGLAVCQTRALGESHCLALCQSGDAALAARLRLSHRARLADLHLRWHVGAGDCARYRPVSGHALLVARAKLVEALLYE
jgi:hypothetical protein